MDEIGNKNRAIGRIAYQLLLRTLILLGATVLVSLPYKGMIEIGVFQVIQEEGLHYFVFCLFELRFLKAAPGLFPAQVARECAAEIRRYWSYLVIQYLHPFLISLSRNERLQHHNGEGDGEIGEHIGKQVFWRGTDQTKRDQVHGHAEAPHENLPAAEEIGQPVCGAEQDKYCA